MKHAYLVLLKISYLVTKIHWHFKVNNTHVNRHNIYMRYVETWSDFGQIRSKLYYTEPSWLDWDDSRIVWHMVCMYIRNFLARKRYRPSSDITYLWKNLSLTIACSLSLGLYTELFVLHYQEILFFFCVAHCIHTGHSGSKFVHASFKRYAKMFFISQFLSLFTYL